MHKIKVRIFDLFTFYERIITAKSHFKYLIPLLHIRSVRLRS